MGWEINVTTLVVGTANLVAAIVSRRRVALSWGKRCQLLLSAQ